MAAQDARGVDPTAHRRRPFHYRTLLAQGAVFAEVAGVSGAIVDNFGAPPEEEEARARNMGICDLSPLPRIGFKGPGALDWLRARGVAVGEEVNLAYPIEGGALAARLAATEVLLLGGPTLGNGPLASLEGKWSVDDAGGCYLVQRQGANFRFLVTGEHGAAMLAKVCGVDLRPHKFPPLGIAQTSVARSNAIVIRHDLGQVPGYHLLGDSAAAQYMWECLIDAMAEFDGGPVGFAAARALAGG